MYCPQCAAEYRAGFLTCSDCSVPLVHDLPPREPQHRDAPADDVVVFRSAVPGETEMIAGALSDIGIFGVVRRGIAGGLQLSMLDGGLTPGQELVLAVPRIAEAKAREAIEVLRPETPDPALALPTPSEDSIGHTGPPAAARATARVILLLLLVPLGLGALAFIAMVILALFGAA